MYICFIYYKYRRKRKQCPSMKETLWGIPGMRGREGIQYQKISCIFYLLSPLCSFPPSLSLSPSISLTQTHTLTHTSFFILFLEYSTHDGGGESNLKRRNSLGIYTYSYTNIYSHTHTHTHTHTHASLYLSLLPPSQV